MRIEPSHITLDLIHGQILHGDIDMTGRTHASTSGQTHNRHDLRPLIEDGKGIYALLLHLQQRQTILIGQLGDFDFRAGYYTYHGSAHGGGGVRSRTDRHKLDVKRHLHWHIDYLRLHARIVEIWYAYDHRDREHDWCHCLAAVPGTRHPVPDFGSSDCGRCDSHLLHYSHRPTTAYLRHTMAKAHPGHQPIYVEILNPAENWITTRNQNHDLLQSYSRGRLFLERRRLSEHAESERDDSQVELRSLRKGSPARMIMEELAGELGCSINELKADAQLAEAVESIISNCGPQAFGVLFGDRPHQTPKGILQLSRTSDVRQQHRIEGVFNGRYRSVAPQSDDDVYDTVGYEEIPSRLRRARGLLQSVAVLLGSENDPEVTQATTVLVGLCTDAATQLTRFIQGSPNGGHLVPEHLWRKTVKAIIESQSAGGITFGRVCSALKLLVKNLWDFPELHRRGLTTSDDLRQECLHELRAIQDIAQVLLSTTPRNEVCFFEFSKTRTAPVNEK